MGELREVGDAIIGFDIGLVDGIPLEQAVDHLGVCITLSVMLLVWHH